MRADGEDQAVRSSKWAATRAIIEVPTDAERLRFGVALENSGNLRVDDFSIEALGPISLGNAPAGPLTERSLENLVAFSQLLGYVRYFHPSDQAARTDWDLFAISAIDPVVRARDSDDLLRVLRERFSPIAPTLRLDARPVSQLQPQMLRSGPVREQNIVAWSYHGWPENLEGSPYYGERLTDGLSEKNARVTRIGSEFNGALGAGLWASVPLSLYADRRGTIPHRGTMVTRAPRDWAPSGYDRSTRLADIILFWNVAKYFYPYFDVSGSDWPAAIRPALQSAAQDTSGAMFEVTLRRLVARLHDGHGSVNSPYGDPRVLPVCWRFIDGKLVVVRTTAEFSSVLHPGDEVVAIDGRPVADWKRETEPQKSAATPQALLLRTAEALNTVVRSDSVQVTTIAASGSRTIIRLPRRYVALLKPPRPDSIAEVAPGIVYADLDRISDGDWRLNVQRFSTARGVIFDLRGYPSRLAEVVPAYLTDQPLAGYPWLVPRVSRPDAAVAQYDTLNWSVRPEFPRLRGHVVFLTDASAISQSEAILELVAGHHLAPIVGTATAGTNGNVADIALPGGYRLTFTCVRVLQCDGSQFHGRGVLPTLVVPPTLDAVRAGRDVQLEQAIAYAQHHLISVPRP